MSQGFEGRGRFSSLRSLPSPSRCLCCGSVESSACRGWRKSLGPSLPRPYLQLRNFRAGSIPI